MITKFGCKNIKAIRTFTKIDIKPITVIMGENSSGKSSLLQALSLLYVNTIFGQIIQKIKYNNSFSEFGDNDSFKNKGEDIELYFEIDDKDTKLLLIYQDDVNNNEYGILKSIKIDNEDMIYIFMLNDLGSYDIKIVTIKNSEYNFLLDFDMTASSKLNAIMFIKDTKEHYYISEILFTPIDLLTNQLQSIRHIGKLKEINEHPLSQARLVEALFPKSRSKKHFNIIETHSEHIVNKLRYMVYKKELKSSDIVIYYKMKDSDEFIKIEIDKKGLFINNKNKCKFPKGFYDATLEENFEIETANI